MGMAETYCVRKSGAINKFLQDEANKPEEK